MVGKATDEETILPLLLQAGGHPSEADSQEKVKSPPWKWQPGRTLHLIFLQTSDLSLK